MSAIANTIDLTNHFLIAMPGMADPRFSKTLTFICEHNAQGAVGLVVNKPIDLTVAALFDEANILLPLSLGTLRETKVLFGGPVLTDRGFVLHQPVGDWKSTLKVNDDTGLTTSKDILDAIAAGDGNAPHRVLIALGYAGWGPGQLEDELGRNGWLSIAADTNLIFNLPPSARLTAAMGMLGLNYGNLSDSVGHA